MRILRPHPSIIGFYDGRIERQRRYRQENWYDDGALELGICSYAIVGGDEAIVYDTHASLEHARVVRLTLENEGFTRIRVVLSHWHADHVAGNEVFADCPILSNAATAAALVAERAALEGGVPPIAPLVMPTETYERTTTLALGALTVELRQLDIHSHDATVVLLPDTGLLLAGDTLEDSITYVTEPERLATHLANLRRMAAWPVARILPNHGDPDRIAAGGYDRRLISATIRYVEALSDRAGSAHAGAALSELLADDLAAGTLLYHPAYEGVHRRNLAAVRALAHRDAGPEETTGSAAPRLGKALAFD